MKRRLYILVCVATSWVLFSCSTRPVAKPDHYSIFTEEEWREMRENGRAKAKAYLQEVENRHPDSITMLYFNWTYLDSIPDFSKYNKVWLIDFSGNEFEKVDKSVFASDNLRYVTFDNCGIRKIDFPEGNHIESLKLTNNQLNRIPASIRKCKNLRSLNLEGNQIRHIPRWLLELDSLEDINLNFNKLKLRKSDIRHLAKAQQLLLAGNDLERLPSNVGQLRCENMNLAKNKLHTLPQSFAELKQLKNLIFYENKFEEIPEVLIGFKNLKHLDFYKNSLTEIPEFVGDMDNLEQLYLSFNEINVIPDTIRNLKRLKYFYIHHNELHFLPEWITKMDSIERFGVGFNHLLEMPNLSKMKSLYEFDAEHNLLERFPWELIEKPEMEIINLRDNDFTLTPLEETKIKKAGKTKTIVY